MSINYYFVNKKERDQVEKYNLKVERIFSNLEKKLEELEIEVDYYSIGFAAVEHKKEYERIHIGKRSMGWKPLFQACRHFQSIEEMKVWYEDNIDEYIIEDEYNEELTWEELEEELINWEGEKTHMTDIPSTRYIKYYICKDRSEWTWSEFF